MGIFPIKLSKYVSIVMHMQRVIVQVISPSRRMMRRHIFIESYTLNMHLYHHHHDGGHLPICALHTIMILPAVLFYIVPMGF
jgi:hypothetical protein